MRRSHLFAALAALFLVVAPGAAQEPRALAVNRAQSDSLGPDDTDAYTIELQANRFVVAEVDQHTIDVVVTVKAPDGSNGVSSMR